MQSKKFKQYKYKLNKKMNETNIRVVFIGNSDVGKTTLVHRIRANAMALDKISNTVGAEFSTATFEGARSNNKINFQLWDTAGQERFRSLVPLYFRYADLFLLVFDISDISSFEAIDDWIQLVRVSNRGNVPMILVGNKSDIRKSSPESAAISEEDIKKKVSSLFSEKSEEKKLLWCEISALHGSKVKELENLICATSAQSSSFVENEEEYSLFQDDESSLTLNGASYYSNCSSKC